MILTHTFPAMGTNVEVLIDVGDLRGAAGVLPATRAVFTRLEAVFSRFDPRSSLSRLNRAGGGAAEPELIELLDRALAAREETDGRFDPTVHDAVVAAGYDRTFDEVAAAPGPAGVAAPCRGDVAVDRARGTVRLGRGVRIDLGAVAKGYAADRACEVAAQAGPCLVNAGGDLAVRGVPDAGVWPVGVDTPEGSRTIGISRGGIATSGRDRRAWGPRGERHHVIDPSTGAPSATDLVRATVAAGTAERAEVLATSLLVAGSRDAVALARRDGLSAVLVTACGRAIATGDLA